jgi:hypothetical protein
MVTCQVVARGRLPLPRAEIFDAEAAAALRGLQEALSSVRAEFVDRVTSSQQIFTAFAEAAQQWPQRARRPHTSEAAAAGEVGSAIATLAYTKRCAKEEAPNAFQIYWRDAAPERYKQLGLGAQKKPAELNFPRFTLGKLYASRSGHGDFAAYHERFRHVDAEKECHCGRKKTPEHFFYCRLGRRAARHPWGLMGVQEVLATRSGSAKLDQWLTESGYFRGVCPPHPLQRTQDGNGNREGDSDVDGNSNRDGGRNT